jgi:hypothetical protein
MMAAAMGMSMMDDEEQNLIEFESSRDSTYHETLCSSCSRTFSQVCYLFKFKEWYLPITFFLIQGVLIPNFDDLHYMFLTEIAGMPKYEYDFLNILTYVGILFFVVLYNKCFPGAQVWILILISLFLFIIMTSLMLINALRINIEWGMSDEAINALIFFLGTQSISTLAYVPMQCILTYLVPDNVEASVMALMSGTFIWSYEVGAKLSASVYCLIFDVDDDHMDNYPRVLIAKLPMLVVMMGLSFIVPNNQEIHRLAARFRTERHKKMSSRGSIKLSNNNAPIAPVM